MKEIYQVIKKYGYMMSEQEYPVGKDAKLMLETSKGVFVTKNGADLANLQDEDIEKTEMKQLPVADREIKAIVYSNTPFCTKCIREKKPFQAILDDMAQIIGAEVCIADGTAGAQSAEKAAAKALENSAGCFVLTGVDSEGKGSGYTVTAGRSLYEAVVAMTVLEKSAEVFWQAQKIGGGKPIAKQTAEYMRENYRKNYSKAEEEVKAGEVK